MKKVIPVFVAIVLIFTIIAISLGMKLVEKYSYSKERADLDEYFKVSDGIETAIVLQDEILEDKALFVDGIYYFSINTVHSYFNTRFYEDSREELLLYTTPDSIYRTNIGSTEFAQNGEAQDAGYMISRYENGSLYIAAEYVKKFTNFSYEVFTEPRRMQVYTQWGEQNLAEVTKDTQIRYQGGVKSEILTATADYFTLKLLCYQGAGSGYQWNYYYTIDLNTGKRLQLKDVFAEGADYITPISEAIKEQMQAQMDADENVYYWLDDEIEEWNFKSVTDETSFYINENGNVVIGFNEGDVAPMYMGAVEFEIPGDVLNDIRK